MDPRKANINPKALNTFLKQGIIVSSSWSNLRGMQTPLKTWPLMLGLGALSFIAAAYNSLFTGEPLFELIFAGLTNSVPGGYHAVVFNRIWGTNKRIYQEGMHFLVPFVETPILFDIRAYPVNIQSGTGSSGRLRTNSLK